MTYLSANSSLKCKETNNCQIRIHHEAFSCTLKSEQGDLNNGKQFIKFVEYFEHHPRLNRFCTFDLGFQVNINDVHSK